MVAKSEILRDIRTFEFILAHPDIVDMMNDPDVNLDSGTVSLAQEFEVVIRKENGGEIVVCCMKPTDLLVLRYKRISDSSSDTEFTDVDVS